MKKILLRPHAMAAHADDLKQYPNEGRAATGYSAGQLRGALSIKRPLP